MKIEETNDTVQETSAHSGDSLYLELKRRVRDAGLLKPQPLYYGIKIPLTFALFAIGWAALAIEDSLWFRIFDVIFLAFMTVQIGYLGHDAGHQQIFRSSRRNDLFGLLNGFSLGSSYSWWVDTHNRHHGKPNQTSFDPAIDYSVLAFSEEEAARKKGVMRWIVKHQAILFIPLLMLYPISMRVDSFRYLLREKSKYRTIEILTLACYFPLYFLFLYFSMGIWQCLLFAVIQQSVLGLYLSSVFVTNHIGMPLLGPEEECDFIRHQVMTSRNVKGSRIVDYLFGGLNYQIEHHLFPRMPRNRLRCASRIVQQFLQEKSIPYCEAEIVHSYCEIFSYLLRIGKSLKNADAAKLI